MKSHLPVLVCGALLVSACNAADRPATAAPQAPAPTVTAAADPVTGTASRPFAVAVAATFNEPWAMTFLPDGRLLVTEKRGALKLFDPASGASVDIEGVPTVDYGGQGGLGDVVLHPQFDRNRTIYLSYAEAGEGGRGAAVARAVLSLDGNAGSLSDLRVIWRQVPKVSGRGHYSHRLAFAADGHLFISSGDRQEFDPAQDMASNLGKIVRLTDEGTAPADNPFQTQGGVAAQVWSLGHRNVLGLAHDAQGQLWSHEMGPKGGDELNRVERGANYGYPLVSDGDHYDGRDMPDHATRPEFNAPEATWTPVISPAGFVIYSGDRFIDWRGDGLIGALSGEALVRIEFDGAGAREAARYPMDQRIREVEQGPEGDVWLLEDGEGGRLLKLSPAG